MTIEEKRNLIIASLQEGKTLSEIGREVFHSTGTGPINNFIDKYGIPISKYSARYAFMDPTWLAEKINECGSPGKVAIRYNMPRTSVLRYANRYGLYMKKFSRTARNAINEHYFDVIDTANKAYWLGFTMADGSVYHYKDESHKVQFELKLQALDYEHLKNFANDIGFPLDKIHTKTAVRKGTETHSVLIRSYNSAFCESLQKYGIADLKSGHESFPRKNIPREFYKDFVRGFWDSDGNIGPHRLYVGSMSLEMISQLSKYFASSDIMTYLEYDLTQTNKKILYRLHVSAQSWEKFRDLIYYPGCIGLNRKIEIAKKIKSTKYGE